MAEDLKTLLTPELFRLMVDHWAPWSKTEPLDFGDMIYKIWFSSEGPALIEPCREKSVAALKALSRLGLDNVPDMMSFLPPPSDPEFPELALGLQLVLDQAPRVFLTGIDVRYTFEYFGAMATEYATQLQALPKELRPTEWEKWREAGVSPDYFIWVRIFWGAPYVHNEKKGKEILAFTNATREFVESLSGRRDPYRERPEERWDLYGFPKIMAGKAPDSPCDFVDGCFFMGYFMDTHYPPLEKFGRYPYWNDFLGRVSTADEEEWLQNAKRFRGLPSEIRDKIRADVEAGRWSALVGE